MSQLVGTAVVFAADNATVAFSGVATTDTELSGSVSLTDAFDKVDLKGAGGRTISRGAANRRHTVSIEIFFKDTGGAATRASAAAKAKLPGMFGTVTLAGFGNGILDGDWNYEGGTISQSTDGFQKANLTISRSENASGTPTAMNSVAAA